jgi:hypothetical protein
MWAVPTLMRPSHEEATMITMYCENKVIGMCGITECTANCPFRTGELVIVERQTMSLYFKGTNGETVAEIAITAHPALIEELGEEIVARQFQEFMDGRPYYSAGLSRD